MTVTDLEYARNEISKKQRKIDAYKEVVNQMAEKLAAVRSSKRNKASQIAALTTELEAVNQTVGHLYAGIEAAVVGLRDAANNNDHCVESLSLTAESIADELKGLL